MTPMSPNNPFADDSGNPFAADMDDENKASTPQMEQVQNNK